MKQTGLRFLTFGVALVFLASLGFWFAKNRDQGRVASVDRATLTNINLPVPQHIDEAVAYVAEKDHFSVVLDKKVIVSGVFDLTPEVIKELKSGNKRSHPFHSRLRCDVGIIDQKMLLSSTPVRTAKAKYARIFSGLKEEYDRKSKGLSLQDKQALKEQYNQILSAYQKDTLAPLLQKLELTTKKVAEQEKVKLVFNREDVAYGGRDITQDVIKALETKEVSNLPVSARHAQNENGSDVGVINMQKLVLSHPSYSRIAELDREIEAWKSGRLGIAETLLSKKELEEWEKARNKSEVAWEKILQEMRDTSAKQATPRFNASSAPPSQAALEKKRQQALQMQQKLNQSYQRALLAKAKALNGTYQSHVKEVKKQTEAELKDYFNQIVKFRNQTLAAKRSELLDDFQKKMDKQQTLLQEEYLQFQKKLMEQDQQAKLDLQLKLSVSQDKEDVENQLKSLEAQEEDQKKAKQEALKQQLLVFRDNGLKQIANTLKQSATSLDKESLAKFNEQKQELFRDSQEALQDEQDNLKQELSAFRAKTMKDARETLGKELSSPNFQDVAMGAKQVLSSKLGEERSKLEDALEQEENDILEHSKRYQDTVQAIKKGNLGLVSEVIKELEHEKVRILEEIRQEIVIKTENVSKSERIQTVLTDVTVNVNARDLTKDVARELKPEVQ